MKRLMIAAAMVLGGTTLALAQDGDLRAERGLVLPVLTAVPSRPVVGAPARRERLVWTEAQRRLDTRPPARGNEGVWRVSQPATPSSGGQSFGGPLLWALVLTASATAGFLFLAP